MSQSATSAKAAPLMTRRLILTGGVAAVTGFAAWRYSMRPGSAGNLLTTQEAHAQATAGRITLIDIRRPDEWEATGVGEGANPIDMRRDDFTDALMALVGGDRDAPIALMCARGVRSRRLTARLTNAGFTNIIDVPEGMLGSSAGPGWLKAGLPVSAYTE